jgi:N-methylhydantoinase A
VPDGPYGEKDLLEIMDIFEQRYEEVYGEGTAYREMGIEIVSMRIDAIGQTPKPVLQRQEPGNASPENARKGTRDVYFSGPAAYLETAIYDYALLGPGAKLHGPAIVETPITTVVVPPTHLARVDGYLNIVLTREREAG